MTEAQLQRLETLIANEIRGCFAALALAIGEAGEKLAAMQIPDEQETPVTKPAAKPMAGMIDRAAAILTMAPAPLSTATLARRIGIKPESWGKVAAHAAADPRFERRYPEGWTSHPLWWSAGGDEAVWSRTMAEWTADREAMMSARRSTGRPARAIEAAAAILAQSPEPMTSADLAARIGITVATWNQYAARALADGRLERRFPRNWKIHARWWTQGRDEAVWAAALEDAVEQRRAMMPEALRNGSTGRPSGDWPELDPPEVIAERNARWEREKPFAADTLVFKPEPVHDFTRHVVHRASLTGCASAMAAEAA